MPEAEQEQKLLTLEEVRVVLAEKSCSGHTEEVRKLLEKHPRWQKRKDTDMLYCCEEYFSNEAIKKIIQENSSHMGECNIVV